MNCPICGFPIKGHPAISRADNETKICSGCGTAEGLKCYVMTQRGATHEQIQKTLLDTLNGVVHCKSCNVKLTEKELERSAIMWGGRCAVCFYNQERGTSKC